MYLDDVLRYNLRYAYFIFRRTELKPMPLKLAGMQNWTWTTTTSPNDGGPRSPRLEDRLAGDPVRMAYDDGMARLPWPSWFGR